MSLITMRTTIWTHRLLHGLLCTAGAAMHEQHVVGMLHAGEPKQALDTRAATKQQRSKIATYDEARTSGSCRMAPRSGVRVSAAFRGVVRDRLEVLQSTCQTTSAALRKESTWYARDVLTHSRTKCCMRCWLCCILLGQGGTKVDQAEPNGAVVASSPAACRPPQSGSGRPSVACCTMLLGRRRQHRATCRRISGCFTFSVGLRATRSDIDFGAGYAALRGRAASHSLITHCCSQRKGQRCAEPSDGNSTGVILANRVMP